MARNNNGTSTNYFQQGLTVTNGRPLGTPQTVSVWFRAGATGSTSNLAFLVQSGGAYFGVLFDGGNAYGLGAGKCIVDNGTINPATSTTIASTTTWNHVCGSRDGSANFAVYLNGGGKSTGTGGANPPIQLDENLCIGVFKTSSGGVFSNMNGDIAEVAFWDATLTDAEVLSLSKGVSPLLIRPSKLWFYAPMRAGTGDAINIAERGTTSVVSAVQTGTMGASTNHPPMLDYRGTGLPVDFTSGGGGGTTTPQSVSITATTTTTVTKAVSKAVAVTATSTSTFVKQAGKGIAATATSTTSFLKAVGKSIAATATTTTTAAAIKVILQTISVTATSSLSVLKSVGKIAAITSTTSTALTRAVAKAVAATATSTTTITKRAGKPLSITATSTTTVGALKVFLQTVAITATTTASMLRSAGKVVAAVATSSTTLGPKTVTKGVGITANATVSVVKALAKAIAISTTSSASFAKAIGKALGIVSTTTSTFGEVYTPSGPTTPQAVNITATTSVTVGAAFVQGQADTHDGDLPADAYAARRWKEEAEKAMRLVQRPAKLAKAAMRIPTQPINTPVTPLVTGTSVAPWTPADDDMDLADILDLL